MDHCPLQGVLHLLTNATWKQISRLFHVEKLYVFQAHLNIYFMSVMQRQQMEHTELKYFIHDHYNYSK